MVQTWQCAAGVCITSDWNVQPVRLADKLPKYISCTLVMHHRLLRTGHSKHLICTGDTSATSISVEEVALLVRKEQVWLGTGHKDIKQGIRRKGRGGQGRKPSSAREWASAMQQG